MQKWEYMFRLSEELDTKGVLSITADAATMWKNKESTFYKVLQDGQNGWELVSAVTLIGTRGEGSVTKNILFIFKRPIAE